jgi:stress response protein YsnF
MTEPDLSNEASTTTPSEGLIFINQSTLQEDDLIRIELYADKPLIYRQTVVRETVPIKKYVTE